METQEVEKNFQEIWKLFAETDKELKETARQMRETDRKLQETTKNVDSLTGKWGKFVEGLVAPAAELLFRERGIRVDRVYQRARARKTAKAWKSTRWRLIRKAVGAVAGIVIDEGVDWVRI